MKVNIGYASEKATERTEYIDTLDDLLALMKQEGKDLILAPGDEDIGIFITVYDGYVE
jgi:hypothetical protein